MFGCIYLVVLWIKYTIKYNFIVQVCKSDNAPHFYSLFSSLFWIMSYTQAAKNYIRLHKRWNKNNIWAQFFPSTSEKSFKNADKENLNISSA